MSPKISFHKLTNDFSVRYRTKLLTDTFIASPGPTRRKLELFPPTLNTESFFSLEIIISFFF